MSSPTNAAERSADRGPHRVVCPEPMESPLFVPLRSTAAGMTTLDENKASFHIAISINPASQQILTNNFMLPLAVRQRGGGGLR